MHRRADNSDIEYRATPKVLNLYGMVCLRQDEWVFSFPAQADVPPCIACYATPGVVNCELKQIRACAVAIMNLPAPEGSPTVKVKTAP